MSDYFEIDFIKFDSSKSGDAIAIRYELNGKTTIHVTDGGFQDTGKSITNHINKFYNSPSFIDRVILTHPDRDHASGLQTVLENFDIGELWMLRPWLYVDELIDRFSRFTSTENLKKRLEEIYPNVKALEDFALKNNIPILEPFQGAIIGEFKVLSPTKEFYLNKVIESEKTPESLKIIEEEKTASFSAMFGSVTKSVVNFIRALWGEELFSDEPTSSENEMSVVQYCNLCNVKTLLTGDAGREALELASEYAPIVGLSLPGIDRFQVPHHGSRRNLSTDLLDVWVGKRLPVKKNDGEELFSSIISAAKDDKDHPRKAVIRSIIHRGGTVVTNQDATISSFQNSPERAGWYSATTLEYPDDQEE